MAISESPSPFDSTRYRVELDYKQHFQPCHSLVKEKQRKVKCLTTMWTESSDFKVIVPATTLRITASKIPNNPAPKEVVLVAKVRSDEGQCFRT